MHVPGTSLQPKISPAPLEDIVERINFVNLAQGSRAVTAAPDAALFGEKLVLICQLATGLFDGY